MTINQMSSADLAERMGSDATDEQASKFMDGLIDGGYGETESAEIPEDEWLRIMRETL